MNFLSWDKLQVKQKIVVFGVGTLLITYLFYNFLLMPTWTRIDELKAQYAVEKQQVKTVEDFVRVYPSPAGYLLELDNKIIEVNNMLPDNPDVSRFILQVEQLATESGLELIYLKPGKIDNKQGYREILMEISIKGSFSGIMNFLHKTEDMSRFISITTISMQVGASGLESKIVAKIYSHGVPPPTANNNNSPESKK